MQKFLDYLRFEKRSSEHTVEAYRVDLQQFSEYLQVEEGNPDILRATSADIRSWMIQLMEEGVTARSINRKVSALRAFYRYHLKMKDVAVNPTEVITAP